MAEREAARDRFLDRIDKRSTKRFRLRKIASNVRLTQDTWDRIDRNRQPMGLTRSAFIAYCIHKVTKSFDQARAIQRGQDE